MINFSKIPSNLPKVVDKQNNSGIVLCWMLSKVFNFKFDIAECISTLELNNEVGFNASNIEKYTIRKKLFYFDAPENTSVQFNFTELVENNIALGLIYTGYDGNNESHISLINYFEGVDFSLTYGNPAYNDLRKVENLYIFFISPSSDISKFVKTDNGKLRRVPN